MKRIHWLELYDPNHQYPVDPSTFFDKEDYVEAVNEWKDYVGSLDREMFAEFEAEEALESDDMKDYRQKAMKQMSRKRPCFTQYSSLDKEVSQEEMSLKKIKSYGQRNIISIIHLILQILHSTIMKVII